MNDKEFEYELEQYDQIPTMKKVAKIPLPNLSLAKLPRILAVIIVLFSLFVIAAITLNLGGIL